MATCTDSWRSTVLTLFAAVLGLVFLLAGAANACPHHKVAQKQADSAAAQHERMSEPPATRSKGHEDAFRTARDSGGAVAECPRMRHSGISDCSTCCGIGSIAAQRPQETVLVDTAPAQPFLPDVISAALSAAIPTAADPFPDRQPYPAVAQTGKTRLVSISRRLRL